MAGGHFGVFGANEGILHVIVHVKAKRLNGFRGTYRLAITPYLHLWCGHGVENEAVAGVHLGVFGGK